MKLIYIAHPFSEKKRSGQPDLLKMDDNIRKARLWYKWACDNYWPTHTFNTMWLINVEVFNDADKQQRSRGMQRNFTHIRGCEELWLLGDRVSRGMIEEGTYARSYGIPVYNLTSEGLDPSVTPKFPLNEMVPWKPGTLEEL